ncbi:MAG: protein translocase subunit SecF [Gammaproteobacteria bacterium]|nr:protein translocase subunit SecF [Gammaproteobacteria bacterium]
MKITNIDFLGNRKYTLGISCVLIVVSIISLITKGLPLGIDFTGGTLIEVGYQEAADLPGLRKSLEEASINGATVQNFGSTKEVLIRLKPQEGVGSKELSDKVLKTINKDNQETATLRRVEFVGPQVGDDLTEDGFLALLWSMIGIFIYVTARFEWKFSVGSVAALFHDVIITLGMFSVFGLEFDLTVLAAILALIGYSINDTIVVFDRIREDFRNFRKVETQEIMNIAINETLSRTIITSLTVVLVLISLVFLGGEVIHNFAIALLFGVVIGTYSSICIASPIALMLGVGPEDLMVPAKEGGHLDGMP